MIIRQKRYEESFTILPNRIFKAGMSAEATGVLCYLLSKPDDWNISCQALANEFGCGRDKMLRIMRELKEKGFAELRKGGDKRGSTWVINDIPPESRKVRLSEAPRVEKPDSRKTRQSEYKALLNTEEEELNTEEEPNTRARTREEGGIEEASPSEASPAATPPPGVDSQAWADFEQHREDMNKPLSQLQREKAIAILSGKDPATQRKIVDRSVLSGWPGLFPLDSQTVESTNQNKQRNLVDPSEMLPKRSDPVKARVHLQAALKSIKAKRMIQDESHASH